MSKVRHLLAGVGTAAILVAVSACGGDDDKTASGGGGSCTPAHKGLKTVKAGTLSVAAYVSPPYTVQQGPQIGGIDGQISAKLAKLECLKLQIKSVAGAALPSTVQSNRADMAIGGVYKNPDRAKGFSLTRPMYRDGLGLLSKDGVDSLDGLSQTTLGVIQGYLWNKEFADALGSKKVKTYQTSTALVSDIKNGRVGAGAFTSAESGLRAKQASLKSALMQPTPKIAESKAKSDVVLLLNKQATALTSALSDDIGTLLGDGTIAGALKANGVDPALAATS